MIFKIIDNCWRNGTGRTINQHYKGLRIEISRTNGTFFAGFLRRRRWTVVARSRNAFEAKNRDFYRFNFFIRWLFSTSLICISGSAVPKLERRVR